jgi:DNA-directed RNA polymerase subunit RPC12/RpoP
MIICVQCRKEMLPDKNGVGADYGNGHVYPGDRYKCPECGYMALATNGRPVYDANYDLQHEYLKMV